MSNTPFNREFADGYEWVEHTDFRGAKRQLLKFPSDVSYRKANFVQGVKAQKTNLYLVEECIKSLSEPGDIIMDIMAGSGSILLGAKLGRNVVAIELQEHYANFIRQSAEKMGVQATVIVGDCTKILPLPGSQAIIFSPPKPSTPQGKEGNLGRLNPFKFNLKMGEIYRLCYQSLKPGGCLAVIIKDFYSGELHQLGMQSMQKLMQLGGFEYQNWFRWMPPGTRSAYHKKMDHRVVEDEHIIMVRKPLDA